MSGLNSFNPGHLTVRACTHAHTHSDQTQIKDYATVLHCMSCLMQPGLEPVASGLQDRSADHQATAPQHKPDSST